MDVAYALDNHLKSLRHQCRRRTPPCCGLWLLIIVEQKRLSNCVQRAIAQLLALLDLTPTVTWQHVETVLQMGLCPFFVSWCMPSPVATTATKSRL